MTAQPLDAATATRTLHTFPEVDQGTDEWHALRCGLVTASVVGRMLTVNAPDPLRYACPECASEPDFPCFSTAKGRAGLALKTIHPARTQTANEHPEDYTVDVSNGDESRSTTRLLVAERITGWADPTFRTADMERGVYAESIARDAYSEHYAPVTEMGFMILEDSTPGDYWWRLGFSPDGLVGDDGLIEIKAPRSKEHLRTILADQVPPQYMAQLQTGLFVSGRQWIDFISFYGGMPLWRKRIEPDPKWFDAIVNAVTEFEKTADVMTDAYRTATHGLPATERLLDMEIVI